MLNIDQLVQKVIVDGFRRAGTGINALLDGEKVDAEVETLLRDIASSMLGDETANPFGLPVDNSGLPSLHDMEGDVPPIDVEEIVKEACDEATQEVIAEVDEKKAEE